MRRKLIIGSMALGLTILILGIGISYLKAQEETVSSVKKFKKNNKFIIALIPEKNVFEQRKRYKYITDYLSEKLNLDVRAEIMSSYGEICDAFLEGRVDAGFFGSFSYVLTHAKAGVVPVARPLWVNGSSTYTGFIFVRKDSGIRTVKDMEDKTIALVHKATTAGYIFQLAYFKEHGIENMEEYFSKIYFAGSHDASAWAVYIGEADVGGGKNHIFNALCEEYPDFKEQMLILAESPEMPSNGLAVRKDLDPLLKKQLKDLLLGLNKTEEGKQVLQKFGAIKFIETKDDDYASLYQMVKKLGIDLNTYPYRD
jgi:phosphonate transport system substrate-binding protein